MFVVGLLVWAPLELLDLSFGTFPNPKKAPGSQKSEAPHSEILRFWLVGAFRLLDGLKN